MSRQLRGKFLMPMFQMTVHPKSSRTHLEPIHHLIRTAPISPKVSSLRLGTLSCSGTLRAAESVLS